MWRMGFHCHGFFCYRAWALGAWASAACWFSSCSSGALVALRHVGSSQTRNQVCVPCIKRQILNHWITREAQDFSVLISELCHRSEKIPEVNLPSTNTHTKCHPHSPKGETTRGLSAAKRCSPTWSLLLLLEEAYFYLLYPR